MNYRVNRICAPAAVLLAGVLVGCSPQEQRQLQQDTHNLAQDVGESLRGATLASKVTAVLSVRKGVDLSGIRITSESKGAITLSGHVRNQEERKRVVDTVNGTTGVDKVVNNLRIEP